MDTLVRHVEVEARPLDDLIELASRACDYITNGIPDRVLADALKGAVAEISAHRHEV